MIQDLAQRRDLVFSVFKSTNFTPIKCHPLSTDSWLPYFTPRTVKWAVRKRSGLEWVFICNARASFRGNSLWKLQCLHTQKPVLQLLVSFPPVRNLCRHCDGCLRRPGSLGQGWDWKPQPTAAPKIPLFLLQWSLFDSNRINFHNHHQ